MAELGRFCRMCGRDISDRHHHAIYCRRCVKIRQCEQIKEFNLFRRPRRQRFYDRDWLLRDGTTDIGMHTRVWIRKNGSFDRGSVEKEQRIIKNEKKKLGL